MSDLNNLQIAIFRSNTSSGARACSARAAEHHRSDTSRLPVSAGAPDPLDTGRLAAYYIVNRYIDNG
jgi:hypothetical protein